MDRQELTLKRDGYEAVAEGASRDYYQLVLRYAEGLNKSASDAWERAILEGCPRPLTAADVLSIAEWIETEGPGSWGKPPEELEQVATDLRAIVFTSRDGAAVIKFHCGCGAILGDECHGPAVTADQMVVIEWMPLYLRSSHLAGGNAGVWPHNGAVRIAVSKSCIDGCLRGDEEWCRLVTGGVDPGEYEWRAAGQV
jgi:hypothetical protein